MKGLAEKHDRWVARKAAEHQKREDDDLARGAALEAIWRDDQLLLEAVRRADWTQTLESAIESYHDHLLKRRDEL